MDEDGPFGAPTTSPGPPLELAPTTPGGDTPLKQEAGGGEGVDVEAAWW